MLEQLQAEHEGFSAGSVAALKQSQHVLGSLADRIRVPDEFVTAVETALGHHLQLVLTEQPEAAQQILNELNTNKKGRASIAALSLTQNGNGYNGHGESDNGAAQGGRAELNGVPLPISKVVESETSVRPLLDRLLGSTCVVRDLGAATAAWRETQGAFHYVTLTGEILSSHGIYTGGYQNGNGNGKAPASILGRRNQIAELKSAVTALHESVSGISRRKGALQSEQTELQASLQQAQTELRAQEVAIATHEGEFTALQNSHRLLHQKIDTVVYEIQSLAGQEQAVEEGQGRTRAGPTPTGTAGRRPAGRSRRRTGRTRGR